MMSSMCASVCVYMCVYTCEERLRLAHTARSRDRTRAGIISSPRATKFLPSPTDPIEQTTIRKHSLARRILRPPFILELYNESPGCISLSVLGSQREKEKNLLDLLNLCRLTYMYIYTEIYERKCILLHRSIILMSRLFRLTRPDISSKAAF